MGTPILRKTRKFTMVNTRNTDESIALWGEPDKPGIAASKGCFPHKLRDAKSVVTGAN